MSDKNSYNNKNPGKNRIVSLVIGFLILFVATFSLGIIVGKGLSERGISVTENTDTVSSRARIPEKTVETKYDEAPVLNERVSESDAEPKEFPEKISTEAPDDLQVKESKKEEPAIEISGSIKTQPDKKAESDREEGLTKIKSTVKPKPVSEKPLATREPKKKTRKAAIEEIAKTDQNKTESRVKLPPIDPNGSYTVQIGSYMDKKAADSVLNSMKNKGYPAYISTMTASDKKKWYRVRIGAFESSHTASDYGENLKILEPEVKIVFITQNNRYD